MEFFFMWVAASVVVGVIASNRERSGLGWFALSMVISPLLAGVLVLALGRAGLSPELQAKLQRRCPECAELVLRAAVKCKHCGSALPPPD